MGPSTASKSGHVLKPPTEFLISTDQLDYQANYFPTASATETTLTSRHNALTLVSEDRTRTQDIGTCSRGWQVWRRDSVTANARNPTRNCPRQFADVPIPEAGNGIESSLD